MTGWQLCWASPRQANMGETLEVAFGCCGVAAQLGRQQHGRAATSHQRPLLELCWAAAPSSARTVTRAQSSSTPHSGASTRTDGGWLINSFSRQAADIHSQVTVQVPAPAPLHPSFGRGSAHSQPAGSSGMIAVGNTLRDEKTASLLQHSAMRGPGWPPKGMLPKRTHTVLLRMAAPILCSGLSIA